jgi:hypothetical protein
MGFREADFGLIFGEFREGENNIYFGRNFVRFTAN